MISSLESGDRTIEIDGPCVTVSRGDKAHSEVYRDEYEAAWYFVQVLERWGMVPTQEEDR